MSVPSRAYIFAACRNAGVPLDDCEDAVQDVLLDCWRDGDNFVGRRVIDAARKYGPRRQSGTLRPTLAPLDDALHLRVPDPYALVDRMIDFMPVWLRLRPTQRKVLLEAALYTGWNNGHQVRASRARLALRRLMA